MAGLFNQQKLVATHTEMSVGKMANLISAEFDGLIKAIYHYKVVAYALHFCEFYVHIKLTNLLE
jgi:hypothetical protein